MEDILEQKKLEKAMPWVGFYIAAASAICTLAMAADAFKGFRRRKLWFPCTHFSLNPTSLTLLGVAMKLTLDLTAVMKNIKIAKLTSLVFLTTSIANFTSSLGSIDGKHVLSNVVALAILVTTVLVDVTIRLIMLKRMNFYIPPMILMYLSLVTMVSLAAAAPSMKQSLEAAYREKYRVTLNEDQEGMVRNEGLGIDDRKRFMMKYWVMVATSNPEFVMARSVVCTMSALLCLISLITLPIAYDVVWKRTEGPSVYGGSVEWILYTQTVGVVVSTVAPLSRWLVVVSFKQETTSLSRMRDEMKVESYWYQTLDDVRGRFSGLKILGQGKFLHDVKWHGVTFFIGVQKSFILLSKLFVLISSFLMTPLFYCWDRFFLNESGSSKGLNLNLSSYAVLLPGEAELPATVVRNISKEAENMIQNGRKKQPKRLTSFISKSLCFKGLGLFDNTQIPSLYSQEPPNCWSLTVVTLASIALAIPHTPEKKREDLLHSVKEGLDLTKLVEKTLLKNNRDLNNIREAVDMCWVGVLLYKKWLDVDINKMSLECKDSSEMLLEFSGKAKTMVVEFLTSSSAKDPLDWPARVIAANSMYRISQSVMLFADEDGDNEERVFERVCVMMADVMAACFTNLGNVMNVMCRGSEIEKREKSVGKAFKLLGKTEEIVEAVQRLEWPAMDHERAAKIEEWQAWFRHTGKVAVGIDETLVCSRDELLAIQVDI